MVPKNIHMDFTKQTLKYNVSLLPASITTWAYKSMT